MPQPVTLVCDTTVVAPRYYEPHELTQLEHGNNIVFDIDAQPIHTTPEAFLQYCAATLQRLYCGEQLAEDEWWALWPTGTGNYAACKVRYNLLAGE